MISYDICSLCKNLVNLVNPVYIISFPKYKPLRQWFESTLQVLSLGCLLRDIPDFCFYIGGKIFQEPLDTRAYLPYFCI